MGAQVQVHDEDNSIYLLKPSRCPNAPKTLDDLRTELDNLAQTVTWSQASLEPLLKVLGRRLARIFTNLMKMMEPIIKFGGGEQVGAGNYRT